ncbi:MAG: tripartite tricarboxylate transporter substrate binding protein [Burkholderiaceae bacterium]
MNRRIVLAFAASLTAVATLPATAQSSYPERPIRFVVGYPAGQSVDMMARTFAEAMSRELGQNIIVDNKPGANGNTLQDFTPIGLLGKAPVVLVAHPSFPANDVRELIELAKKQPGKIDYASGGSGITAHLAMELFNDAAGIQLVHVPYKGSPAAMNDVIGGHVPLMMESVVAAIPHIKSGKVKALGISSTNRYVALPDVASIHEQGVRNYEVAAWSAMVVPAGTPAEIVSKLNAALVKAGQDAAVQRVMQAAGVYELGSTSDELKAVITAEIPNWTRAVQKSGAQVD